MMYYLIVYTVRAEIVYFLTRNILFNIEERDISHYLISTNLLNLDNTEKNSLKALNYLELSKERFLKVI